MRVTITFLAISFFLGGSCESYDALRFVNNSDQLIGTFINIAYPDTTFDEARICTRVKPHSSAYICSDTDLDNLIEVGATIFALRMVEYTYDPRQILKKWILLRSDLDRLDWTLTYP
jgi:hypothetical protein